MKKVDIDYNWIKNLLKAATYAAFGTASTIIIQAIQGGTDINQALLVGAGLGIIAGIKNLFKHAFNVDLDLTKLKKD